MVRLNSFSPHIYLVVFPHHDFSSYSNTHFGKMLSWTFLAMDLVVNLIPYIYHEFVYYFAIWRYLLALSAMTLLSFTTMYATILMSQMLTYFWILSLSIILYSLICLSGQIDFHYWYLISRHILENNTKIMILWSIKGGYVRLAEQLRTLAIPARTQVQFPPPIWRFTNSCNTSPRRWCPLLASMGNACTWCLHISSLAFKY